MSSLIKIKRGVLARWTSTNPILARGELGFVVDESKLKCGDGAARFVDLPYIEGGVTVPGPAGPQGLTGATGSTGAQGPQGEPGATGPQGIQGPQGIKGDTGDTGPQGIQGPAGSQGVAGPQGEVGPQGPTGPAGASGAGGSTPITTTIEVTPPVTYFEATRTAVGATPSSVVRASLALRTDGENDIEHAADIGLKLHAQAETGLVRFILTAQSRFTGPMPIVYEVFS